MLFTRVSRTLAPMNNAASAHTIAAPIERVFDVFSDFASMPDRIKGIKRIEVLTPGAAQVGTRFRETRRMHGHDSTEEMEVTAIDRPTMYAVSCRSCGCQITTTFRFERIGEGTRVTTEIIAHAKSWFAKLLSPFRKMLIGMIQRCVNDDVLDLKLALETAETAAV